MLSKILTLFVLSIPILFGTFNTTSFGGIPNYLGENESEIVVSYFDTRQRTTHVQVTNTDSINPVTIHVQIFADTFECEDRDFNDTLTPNETHVYDISNLVSANGNPINFAIPDNSHGFVIISAGDGMGSAVEQIIGNFRITDVLGYEYRVNSAALEFVTIDEAEADRVGRFSMEWGANQADIVGVDVGGHTNFLPDGTRDLDVDIPGSFELFIFDDEETGTSCGEVFMGCDENPGSSSNEPQVFTTEFINQGINDVFPNSRGGGVLCPGDFNTEGYINLRSIDAPEIVGFLGLNDGAARGSMDRFKIINIRFGGDMGGG